MKLFAKIIKWFFFLLVILITIWFLVNYAMYRITSDDDKVKFEGEMHYKLLELNFTNRQLFEELIGNRIIRIEGVPILYGAKPEWSELWPESPHDMIKKEYTIKTEVSVQPLYFGGYGLIEVNKVERLNKKPIIEK